MTVHPKEAIPAIPEDIKALLKVRVNHDLELRDTGQWISSVSVYKALREQQRRLALAEHERDALLKPISQREIIQRSGNSQPQTPHEVAMLFNAIIAARAALAAEPGEERE